MNDVIFFAPNNGQAPGIWATGNVNGTYSTAPNLGQAVTLAGQRPYYILYTADVGYRSQ